MGASAIDSKARQLSQPDWSTYCTDVIGRAVLTSARRWKKQLVGGSGQRREERGGEVAAGESGGAAAVGDGAGGSGGEREGLRGGGSEAEGVAGGEWQGRESWVQGEAVRGAVEDGRWALYCHLLAHLRFNEHGRADSGIEFAMGCVVGVEMAQATLRIARVVLDELVVEMAGGGIGGGTGGGVPYCPLHPVNLGGSRGTGVVGLKGGIGGWEVDGEASSVVGQGRGGEAAAAAGEELFSPEGFAARSMALHCGCIAILHSDLHGPPARSRFPYNPLPAPPSARQVSLHKWVRRNVTSVVAIFEDRFLPWGLHRSSPLPVPRVARPALSQQQHTSQVPPVSVPDDFTSAHCATARNPLRWLQGLLRIRRASGTGGEHKGSKWHKAVVAGAEEGEGAGTAGEGGRPGGSGAAHRGGQQTRGAATAERMVRGGRGMYRKLLVVVALKISDLLLPLFKAAVIAAGRAVSFLLVALIGHSLGLVYRGIRQSWGQAL
ncbi:unnamed protein product [Closterium sp. NIES-64]|nr:unnamed protein product [Closterium sp. NIES-64]